MDEQKKVNKFILFIKNNFLFMISLIVMFLIFSSFGFSIVSGESMENTLHHKNVLLVKKDSILYKNSHVKYKKGDIVIAWSDELNKYIIKRVIAEAGDTIEIKNNEVYINQELIKENYIKDPMETADISQIHIPKGSAFLMGDNRNNSTDSRTLGLIKDEDINGKVITRIFGR